MKVLAVVAIVAALIVAAAVAVRWGVGAASDPRTTPGPTGSVPGGETATVAHVVDGDTIVLDSGARVRLVQIDAPEARGGECYGKEAAARLAALLPSGTAVRIVTDPALDATDRYGRTLGYVFRDGEHVNRRLVADGAASVWFYGGVRGRHADELLAAARDARAAGRGLWRACEAALDPLSPLSTHRRRRPRRRPSRRCRRRARRSSRRCRRRARRSSRRCRRRARRSLTCTAISVTISAVPREAAQGRGESTS